MVGKLAFFNPFMHGMGSLSQHWNTKSLTNKDRGYLCQKYTYIFLVSAAISVIPSSAQYYKTSDYKKGHFYLNTSFLLYSSKEKDQTNPAFEETSMHPMQPTTPFHSTEELR